jgi:type IV pilus assembly protein PilQ
MDGEAASINQGTKIPYATTSSEGTKTEFQSADLSLQVTPEIQPDGWVLLNVTVSNNEPGASFDAGVAINTQNIKTLARVKNGKTLVLGGIYKKSESYGTTGVPWLSKIPVLGWLFKTKTQSDGQSELLIFITPRIIEERS